MRLLVSSLVGYTRILPCDVRLPLLAVGKFDALSYGRQSAFFFLIRFVTIVNDTLPSQKVPQYLIPQPTIATYCLEYLHEIYMIEAVVAQKQFPECVCMPVWVLSPIALESKHSIHRVQQQGHAEPQGTAV